MGGEFKGEWIHVYVWLSPFTVHLKLSQYCQSHIPQNKIKSFFKKKKKTLIPNVIVFGNGALGEGLGLDEVMRVQPSWWHWCPYKKRYCRVQCLSFPLPCKDASRWQPSATKKRALTRTLSCWCPDLGLPSLQNCEKINGCCLSHPVYGILLQ